jgi:hypothetical protein
MRNELLWMNRIQKPPGTFVEFQHSVILACPDNNEGNLLMEETPGKLLIACPGDIPRTEQIIPYAIFLQ